MITVQDVYTQLDRFAPFSTQEPWDNSGLLIGARDTSLTRCIVALDCTKQVIKAAVDWQAQLIITHHPIIFDPLTSIDPNSAVCCAIRADIAVLCAHTNLDIAQGGVNDCLSQTLGLRNIRPFLANGLGRIGELPQDMTAAAVKAYLMARLGTDCIRMNDAGYRIHTVVVVGGAGGSELEEMRRLHLPNAAYITGDVKHSTLIEAQDAGVTLFDAGHDATERTALQPLAAQLGRAFPLLSLRVM